MQVIFVLCYNFYKINYIYNRVFMQFAYSQKYVIKAVGFQNVLCWKEPGSTYGNIISSISSHKNICFFADFIYNLFDIAGVLQ